MISIRDFLVFLSEYRCLGSYWSNFEKAHFVDEYHGASRLFSCYFDEEPWLWIIISFNWERSGEGFDYWSRLNTLWDRRCDDLLKK